MRPSWPAAPAAMRALALGLALALPVAAAADGRMSVFVSVPPQAWVVERIGGERVTVHTMVPAGRSPHAYEPLPRQLAELARARVYFRIGVSFETGMLEKIRASHAGLRIVDMREGVALIEGGCDHEHEHGHEHGNEHGDVAHAHGHDHGEGDPHLWLDPRRAQTMARTAAQVLGEIDPQGAAAYQVNLARLETDLEATDRHIAEALAPIKGSPFLVYHPAFGYLAERYGLKQVAVELDGKEPGARQVAELIRRARAEGIRVVFVQTGFPRAGAEAIAREIGGAVVTLDPLARDVVESLEAIARQLTEELHP